MGREIRGTFVHRITTKIAEAEAVAVEELPPIGDVIDTEALDRVLQSSRGDALVQFTYHGYSITARSDGKITVREPTRDESSYVTRCNTCDEERVGLDLGTAHDVFARHADEGHAVEIVRGDGATDGRSGAGDDSPSEELTRSD